MSTTRFNFARGNLLKLLAAPKYLLSAILAFFVPRSSRTWVFGSGIGVGEGALVVARVLRNEGGDTRIRWVVADEAEAEIASAEGFEPVLRRGWRGFWSTLRAGQLVVTHGAGDVNRFGVFGGRLVHLIHGAPLKRLHLDSPITTQLGKGSTLLHSVLRRMYDLGTRQVSLYVAGSVTAAERLRSAYRVLPGKVMVLGDPRDDMLSEQVRDPQLAAHARAELLDLLDIPESGQGSRPLVLYAPTWRDGDLDPGVPGEDEIAAIVQTLEDLDAQLVIRSHPLGAGAYEAALGDRVRLLGVDVLRDITPVLGGFDAVITDYSSIAVDFSLFGRPIVWFAPDLERYSATRGLYEPLEVTSAGRVQLDWIETMNRLAAVLREGTPRRMAQADARALASRFHAFPQGAAAARVLAEIRRLSLRDAERVPEGAIFFESFYGRQVSCNPLALDRRIAQMMPGRPRFWSVESERIAVPEGAIPLLIGSRDWHAVRRRADLLIVNDWLRHGFRRRRGQTVLQTWHGTMLKRLALDRPQVSLRTRIAARRESRRWSVLLSQNPHSTEQFRRSYAYRGEILEVGYPRDDRLADSLGGNTRIAIAADGAKRELGVPRSARVLAYTPTWRAEGGAVDLLDVYALAEELGDEWVVVARGHTRSAAGYLGHHPRVIDASHHPDVNDVILAADLLVTDYSSIMFDAAVARVPMLFFVPDLVSYRDRERGFTFDFERLAPGPLVTSREQVIEAARVGVAPGAAYDAWCERFTPHDDGQASARVIEALAARGAL